jgi:hypothetical protein
MAFFDNLTTLLKQKWLQFFQVNRSWITLQMEVESVYTPDGGRRPPSSFILGVVNALEPQLAELMLPFSKLNPDADNMIDVLELNFDPDLMLGNRFISEDLSDDIVIQTLTELDLDELSDISLDEMAEEVVLVETDDAVGLAEDMALDEMTDEVVLVATDDQSVMVLSLDEATELVEDLALDEIPNQDGVEEMSNQFLEQSSPQQPIDQSVEMPSSPQQNESGNVLGDVWVEDASSNSEPAGNTRLGEQFEDDEISRLFPNL